MSDYPFLSLAHIDIDAALARQLPRRLAYYYLAFPLARDEDQLTVVMAHPDNQSAIALLQNVLGMQIVPVQGSASEIRAILNRLWDGEADSAAPHILAWGSNAPVAAVANVFASALAAEVLTLDAAQTPAEAALTVARKGQYSLTVIDALAVPDLSLLLRESSTPVLLVRGETCALRRTLLVLRGHSPDDSVLDWVIPLAQAGNTRVTLLTVAPTAAQGYRRGSQVMRGLAPLLAADSAPGDHIAACVERLTAAGIEGQIKLRQGVPEEQIALEVKQNAYDLITIAAEAYGDFVQRVLVEIERQSPQNRQPVLVIKPIRRL